MNPSSVPPPPPPLSTGNIPSKRLQTQMAEAPACVQNAMMTKDKKPFTYTPGGIDLSQIKSPRMAKRISMNANSPGVQPKVSPLAQNSSNGSSSPAVQTAPKTPLSSGSVPPPPPPPSMGSLAMGMPFQVFPTGPAVNKNNKIATPQNGNTKKSPQSFEPPPMGCRPEIKIPANPMSILKPAPRPQPKGDFWVQEYVQEKACDSLPSEEEARQQISSSPVIQQYQQQQQPSLSSPTSTSTQKEASPIRYAQRSPSPPEQRELSGPVRNVKLEDVRTSSPVQGNRSPPVMSYSPVPSSMPSPITPVKTVSIEPLQAYKPPAQTYQQPAQTYQQPAQSHQQPAQGGRVILSTMPNRPQQQAQQHLGSLYIPPPMSLDDKQYLLSQQSPPWMSSSSKLNPTETPEWVNRDEVDNFMQQARGTQTPQSAGPREHVISVLMDKTSNKTPVTPGFGPTPFYGMSPQQFNNVVSPKVDPNANQFVNQGYNNIDFPQTQNQAPRSYAQPQKPQQSHQQQQFQQQQQQFQQQQQQFQQQQQQFQQSIGVRIIPIQVEGARSTQNDPTVVFQSDPRSPPSPRVNADESEAEQQRIDNEPMREQQALFSRPLGPDEMNETQLRRLQLSENDRAFMNRVKTQVDDEVYLHSETDPRYKGSSIPSKAFKVLQIMTDGAPNNVQSVPVGRPKQQDDFNEQQNREPHLYQGATNPGRSFKILQAMTQPENAGPGASDL